MTTLLEINRKADRLLREALPPVEYARYRQQFGSGSGDYTSERQEKPEQDSDVVAVRVAKLKKAGLLKL